MIRGVLIGVAGVVLSIGLGLAFRPRPDPDLLVCGRAPADLATYLDATLSHPDAEFGALSVVRAPGRGDLFYVAAELRGTGHDDMYAVWVTNDLGLMGFVLSVNPAARIYSGIPDRTERRGPYSASDEAAVAAVECARDS